MKNKLIKEGFKFFAICDASTDYVHSFHPDGRVEKSRNGESILLLADTLPQGEEWLYVIAMDNYFNTSTVVKGLCECNIGVVGTACA